MAVVLNLSGTESTDFTTVTLTDTTANWGAGTNINFDEVMYAEMFVKIGSSLYGPLNLTSTFTSASAQSDLVFTITPSDLDLDQTTFDDGLQEYYYGVSADSTPDESRVDIWNLSDSFSDLSIITTKIPYTIEIEDPVREYELSATIRLHEDDPSSNPKMVLNVNYSDGTYDSDSIDINQNGLDAIYTISVDTDLKKTVTSVSGNLIDEDRVNISGRIGSISNISLNAIDLDIISVVKRGLLVEKAKKKNEQDLIALGDKILCGRKTFEEHERTIVRSMSLRAITNGATRGLASNITEIINFLNDDC